MQAALNLDHAFAALADPTRRAILERLAEGEATVMDLAAPFTMSQPAISRHIKVLEQAGLIARRVDAQRRPCRLVPQALAELERALEQFRLTLEGNYTQLDALMAQKPKGESE